MYVRRWREPQVAEPHVLEPPPERPVGLSSPGTSASCSSNSHIDVPTDAKASSRHNG
jgi:hypothetical protein